MYTVLKKKKKNKKKTIPVVKSPTSAAGLISCFQPKQDGCLSRAEERLCIAGSARGGGGEGARVDHETSWQVLTW